MFELDLEEVVRARRYPWRSRQSWRLLLALFPCGCMGASLAGTAAKAPTTLTELFVWLAFAFAFTELAMFFIRSWWQINHQSTVEEAIKHDTRLPILYLRPFAVDRVRFTTFRVWVDHVNRFVQSVNVNAIIYSDEPPDSLRSGEELIVQVIDHLGPIVAIGKPGETVPPIGAARLYLGNEWRDVVREYMRRSQLVLLFAGSSPGFVWEIGQVFEQKPFVPVLLFLPFFRRYRQSEVDRFTALFHEASDIAIPSELRHVRGLYFPDSSTFVQFAEGRGTDEDLLNGLNPFLGVVIQFMEQTRPGWGQSYIESAKEERRKSWLLMAGASMLLALLAALTMIRQSSATLPGH